MASYGPTFCDITWGAGGTTADLTLDIAAKMQNMVCSCLAGNPVNFRACIVYGKANVLLLLHGRFIILLCLERASDCVPGKE